MASYTSAPRATMPITVPIRNFEFTFAKLLGASRHLDAGHRAYQYVDDRGNVIEIVDKWRRLSGLGKLRAYRDAEANISRRWIPSPSGLPDVEFRHFATTHAPSALASVVYKSSDAYLTYTMPPTNAPLSEVSSRVPLDDLCMAVAFELTRKHRGYSFRLSPYCEASWGDLKSTMLYEAYRRTCASIVGRYGTDALAGVQTYGDLLRMAKAILLNEVLQVFQPYVTPEGYLDVTSSPRREVVVPSQDQSGVPRGGSPAYTPDHYDPTANMSL